MNEIFLVKACENRSVPLINKTLLELNSLEAIKEAHKELGICKM